MTHVLLSFEGDKDVDGRDEPGHDENAYAEIGGSSRSMTCGCP